MQPFMSLSRRQEC